MTIKTIYGQLVTWTDGEITRVPTALTPRLLDDAVTVKLDMNEHLLEFDRDVTRARFVCACNVLLVEKWIRDGRPEDERPTRMEV